MFSPYNKKRCNVTNLYITELLPGDFRESHIRNKIKEVNELMREKCLSSSTSLINYIEQDHDWIDLNTAFELNTSTETIYT